MLPPRSGIYRFSTSACGGSLITEVCSKAVLGLFSEARSGKVSFIVSSAVCKAVGKTVFCITNISFLPHLLCLRPCPLPFKLLKSPNSLQNFQSVSRTQIQTWQSLSFSVLSLYSWVCFNVVTFLCATFTSAVSTEVFAAMMEHMHGSFPCSSLASSPLRRLPNIYILKRCQCGQVFEECAPTQSHGTELPSFKKGGRYRTIFSNEQQKQGETWKVHE